MQNIWRKVRANKIGVRQVLINLLSNVVKYNIQAGKVWIIFSNNEYWVNITIKDEECGFPQNELSHIFQKFYRAAGIEWFKGAGIDLYIVKLLTEAMGGKILVASEQGTGSTFTVSFPAVWAAPSGTAQ